MAITLIDRIKFLFRKEKELYSSLYRILGFYPHNILLYKQALSHKSLPLHNKDGRPVDNERLEFLGDAIIEAAVSDIVFHHFPARHEGFLTSTRSKMVNREALNKLAKELGLEGLIQSSAQPNGHNSYLGGNAFEALVGAIYLDRGYKHCQWFLEKRILTKHVDIDRIAKQETNFKGKLLEWAQKNQIRIEFIEESIETSSTEKAPIFHSHIKVEKIVCGKGEGFSKKESHQHAAEATLKLIKNSKFKASIINAHIARIEAEHEARLPLISADSEGNLGVEN